MKVNKLKLGLGVLTVLATPIAVNTVASSDALAAQGWVKTGNAWYFYNQNGVLARNAWAGNYWLGADGKMVTNAWVDNGRYYVDANGAWVKGAQKPAVAQKQGWVQSRGAWYYYYQGNVVINAWVGNYWLGADGRMATSSWVDNGRYYVGSNGEWVRNAQKPEEKKQGWVKDSNTWYYYNTDGTLARNKWAGNYWLGADGRMSTNSWVDNGRYYVGSNGEWVRNAQKPEEKKQGWIKESNTWYYYNTDGTLARNKWVGNYWLGADGRMATNSWVDNNRYYVGTNGAWIKDARHPEEKKQGWVKESNTWYYYNTDGTLARNKWAGNYWLGADGRMSTNSWVDNNRYYVGADGAWVKDASRDKNIKRAIFLDPGHGGSDSGAVENGVREKDLTLSVYNKVSSRLASLGYTVLTSRNTDKDVGLVSRADQANKSNADMFLSIHFNAGGRGTAYGIETYYYKHEQGYEPEINKDNHNSPERIEKSRKLANKIQQNLLYKTGAYDRGVKRASFAVLRETSIPSILVELGFIDNQEEVNKIKTNEYQEKLADGIVDGIVEYYK
ncbi:N-acetylmuramoyl-L-alanine amidase [Gemella haemolysans]|uniref:N-acetylmuramoyl-L-alanine amidase n=2 Tax=Gemella haemolysans TaxID=1379 RepID=UPI00237925D4|nr:N-acetylmuramoyl-L-alanine amidase [Gemella haemolysans]